MNSCTPLCREARFQVKMYKTNSVRTTLEVEMSKKCTPLWREAHFQVKMCKTHHSRTTFGSCDVEKVHAVAARSTFRSQNAQSTPFSDHFWKLRCRKSARCCSAKHISKSKCTKHTILGPLLEAAMSKKCTLLRREVRFEVNMYKTHVVWGGRRKGLCTMSKVRKTRWHFQLQPPLHYTTLHSNTLHYTTATTTTTSSLHSITLRDTPLHYIALNHITLHYTTLHYSTLHSTTLHYTTLPYLPLHCTTLHYTTTTTTTTQLHSTTLHDTPLH